MLDASSIVFVLFRMIPKLAELMQVHPILGHGTGLEFLVPIIAGSAVFSLISLLGLGFALIKRSNVLVLLTSFTSVVSGGILALLHFQLFHLFPLAAYYSWAALSVITFCEVLYFKKSATHNKTLSLAILGASTGLGFAIAIVFLIWRGVLP